jgi:YebC/PmpR family DNA-binding regulatory protein
MAGHNKWSKVKHIKGAADAKRGKIFSRLAKEISLAAKTGGGDPDANARLRSAVMAARAQNMPNDNIDRAVKRGTGEGGAGAIEEQVYEAYAPGGVALLIEVATDNKNRTAADLRLILTKNHGNLASSGAVAYQFRRAGQITVTGTAPDEDRLLEIVLVAGADELTFDEGVFTVLTAPEKLYTVAESLKAAGRDPESLKLVFVPGPAVAVTGPHVAQQVLRLCEALDESDDVQNIYSDFDMAEELLAQLTA